MIELCDNVSTNVLDKHAVVYEHLTNLYESQYRTIYGRLTGVLRVLIFQHAMSELIEMAQNNYLENYYERIIRNAV